MVAVTGLNGQADGGRRVGELARHFTNRIVAAPTKLAKMKNVNRCYSFRGTKELQVSPRKLRGAECAGCGWSAQAIEIVYSVRWHESCTYAKRARREFRDWEKTHYEKEQLTSCLRFCFRNTAHCIWSEHHFTLTGSEHEPDRLSVAADAAGQPDSDAQHE